VLQLPGDEIKMSNPPISQYLKTPADLSDEAAGKIVGLEYFHNHELKKVR